MKPVYQSLERSEAGDPAWPGDSGELTVSEARTRHSVSHAFVEAAVAAGIAETAETADFNTDRQEGAGFYRFSIHRGLRHSSANAFIDPVRSRGNLSIVSEALTTRILFEGRRAVGVAYRQGDALFEVRAGEVIVAAGAVNAPQLLMLSGLGPATHLAEHGIPVVADFPAVGGNLQDHLYVHHLVDVTPGWSSNAVMRGPGAVGQALHFLLRRRGVLALGASQSGAFVRSNDRFDRPDLQLMFKAYSLKFGADGRTTPSQTPGVTTSISQVRPQSRGRISLASADPAEAPSIQANYLAETADREAMIAGLRWARRIFAAATLSAVVRAETAPGSSRESDAELLAFIRAAAQSMYHPVGTCWMGDDARAVVDARLRVHKVEGLRVADASIMPTIPAGNTNAPSMMIGAKAAGMILEDAA